MLSVGGASAVIHYTPTVITSSSLSVGNGGAVVLMEPSGLITTVTSNGAEDEDQQHHHHHHHRHHHQGDGGNDEASAGNNADHSPIHLPSTAFLNTHISKSVNNPFSIIVSCVLFFCYGARNIIPTLTAQELVCAPICSPLFSCPRSIFVVTF